LLLGLANNNLNFSLWIDLDGSYGKPSAGNGSHRPRPISLPERGRGAAAAIENDPLQISLLILKTGQRKKAHPGAH